MATQSTDNDPTGNVRRLSDAVRRVRIAEAERTDAFADLYEADKARLTLVTEELSGVFGELPDDDFFVCAIAGSSPPRLWIDATSHVVMARDRRTYRFLKDTRIGRIVLFENTDHRLVADAVTDYIAERIVARERAIETDFLLSQIREKALPAQPGSIAVTGKANGTPSETGASAANAVAATLANKPVVAPRRRARGFFRTLLLIVFGAALGVLGLIAYSWFMAAH